MRLRQLCLLFILPSLLGLSWPFSWLFAPVNTASFGTRAWVNNEIRLIKSQTNNIDDNVLRLSLNAYMMAKKKGLTNNRPLLTVIDYSKPSSQKRLWVFNLQNGRPLFNTWVSHGKNSGDASANSFSNQPGSLKSSIGVFLTEEPYVGSKGYSLRLKGIERGINDNAYRRAIVVHGAWYVSSGTIKQYGQVGRSWGCPAVSTDTARSLIDTIKENTLVFAYYPDRNWLKNSVFVSAA